MFPLIFEILIYFKVLFVILISFYIAVSKKNEPSDFPDTFEKTYSFKKKINSDN